MARKNNKVAIFVDTLQGGGAERSTINLANALAEAGETIDLLVVDSGGVFKGLISSKVNLRLIEKCGFWKAVQSIRTLSLFYLFLLFLTPGSPKPLRFIPALSAYLYRERPAALMSVLAFGNVASILARETSKVPTRVVIGQRNHLSKEHCDRHCLRRWLVRYVLRYFYAKAAAIVAVSDGVRMDLCDTLSIECDNIFTVYNAVADKALDRYSREQLDHAWFNNAGAPVILAAGKLKPQKDFPTLLHAFQLVRKVLDAKLIILGIGPELDNLMALAHQLRVDKHVLFEGFVDNPFKYMANADLFVLSSAYEGLPGVLIQALACGCPVVSTDCPSGPHEILEGGEFGDLVPVGDPAALSEAIISSLQRTHDRSRLKSRGYEFSGEAAVNGYLRVLSDGETPNSSASEDKTARARLFTRA